MCLQHQLYLEGEREEGRKVVLENQGKPLAVIFKTCRIHSSYQGKDRGKEHSRLSADNGRNVRENTHFIFQKVKSIQ